FLNFEDPRLSGALDHATLQSVVEAFAGDRGDSCCFFFDEIQAVDGWQQWLRTQLDRPRGHRFAISGSNAHMLSGELGSTLSGRHHRIELFPFDLEEYRELRPRATVAEYLDAGGFPAPATSPDHDLMLRAYFHDIVERDVRERVGARSSLPLRQLVQVLFESAGSELSMRRAAGAIGMSVDTTQLYVEALEGAYMAFSCPFFAWSERKRSARNRKYYPVDSGLRRIAVTRTGDDRGKQLECATYLLLRRRFAQVFYWRGKGEVDFVVSTDAGATPVQVSWDGARERHDKALEAFYEEHPNAAEAVLVDAETFAAGLPELADGT
ncbi:MAG: ATP-binding protein, partial [Planctomycetes bacterium]|nr:ATP-binding protein [Planctomycetota bacterium]